MRDASARDGVRQRLPARTLARVPMRREQVNEISQAWLGESGRSRLPSAEIERIKWLLWHGNLHRASRMIEDFEAGVDAPLIIRT